MKTEQAQFKVRDILDLRKQQMLVVNPEYQRGAVWTTTQKKKLIDSMLRGYPLPMIYLHHIQQKAGGLISQRFEVIDGQQRINAVYEYCEGALKLFDPVKDEKTARFPAFIKTQSCPWAGKSFPELTSDLKDQILETPLPVVKIETHDANEARDLFVRLQAGMPLNSQEKRDAWPGEFTDFVLRLGGKAGIARYPGYDFFNQLMGAKKSQDRGKFRQLAAQIAMLYLTRRGAAIPDAGFCDINASAIDEFYYENLGFDQSTTDAQRLFSILERLAELLGDKKRSKIVGHEAIHLVLLADSLWDNYTPSWQSEFAAAFDKFREEAAKGKLTSKDPAPSEYWTLYTVLTRVNSDRAENIRQRHAFFATKMCESMALQLKDPKRLYDPVEREIIYARDKKKCGKCGGEVLWVDAEIHHIEEHHKGGKTSFDNAVLMHEQCHPKGSAATEFAKQWKARLLNTPLATPIAAEVPAAAAAAETDAEDDEEE
jgi:5-methylcytosine-specific restriction endonuclease McrA